MRCANCDAYVPDVEDEDGEVFCELCQEEQEDENED